MTSRPTRPPASAALVAEVPPWGLGPFVRQDHVNPILTPRADTVFRCPLRGEVAWEAKDVFNPAAVVKDGKVWLLYRAEDTVGRHAGTSRIGLACSDDGLCFTRLPQPVLFPDKDAYHHWEWEGGCEDPRIVTGDDGTYVLTYTAFDGVCARLCVATSRDLVAWTKHGPAFAAARGGRWLDAWSKSGAIVCRQDGDHLVAVRIDGRYWMYFGESDIYAATSDDLLAWTPVEATVRGPAHARTGAA
ncbi:MAG: glycosidase, partial [Planctomycetes bacterium]|nr:glycosidase [Planctomycetota bacterium]